MVLVAVITGWSFLMLQMVRGSVRDGFDDIIGDIYYTALL
jgi:hypothetical protein